MVYLEIELITRYFNFKDLSITFIIKPFCLFWSKLSILCVTRNTNKKLEYYKFDAIALISSYFSNHVLQRAKFKDNISCKGIVRHGVLKRSIIRPILLLIYINDIPQLAPRCYIMLYADDTNVGYSLHLIALLNTVLQDYMKNIENWLVTNKVPLYKMKTM